MMGEFSDRLRMARQKMGLTQHELSVRSGVLPVSISRYERGQTSPTMDSAKRLAEALDADLTWLMQGKEAADSHPAAAESDELSAFLASGEGASATDEERATLAAMGTAAASQGYTILPMIYAMWLSSLRMAARLSRP